MQSDTSQPEEPQESDATPIFVSHGPTPPAPEPSPATDTVQTPPPAEPRPMPVQNSAAPASNYSSNPFMSISRGLGRALSVNPIASLTIVTWTFLFGIVGVGVSFGLLFGLPGAAKLIGGLLLFLVWILLFFRISAASTIVHRESHKGNEIKGREAVGKLASHGFGSFGIAQILSGIMILIGVILLIIPGIIIYSRLALVPFAVYEEGLGAMAAIKRSWKLTKHHTWEMIGIACAQVFFVGFSGGLLTYIAMQAGPANRYYELVEAEKNMQSKAKTHWMNYLIAFFVVLFVVGYGLLIGLTYNSNRNLTGSSTQPYITNTTSAKDYCYFGSNNSSTCVDQQTCKTTTACSQVYFSSGSTTTTTTNQ